jgi:hypothetical protein
MKVAGATLAALVVAGAFGGALGFSDGPPDGRTGAPGEFTCADCHGNLNTGDGRVTVDAPSAFAPGDTIRLVVRVAQGGQVRWGFELTVLDDADVPVGDLIVVEPARTQFSLDTGTGRQYVKHTSLGTDLGSPDVSPGWTVDWASPDAPLGAVTFYIAGNAANGDGSSTGDFTYTNALMYGDDQTSAETLTDLHTTWSRVKALFK